ncbi:hypothetical protein HHI36_007595 [Cryptolaemus montrouzieri]|uniref:Uncharacterized protein n=1 Tax=Cryptolaemus montrouzieri TaxID=559131 RepID=A0ABD2MQ60_9CUCU
MEESIQNVTSLVVDQTALLGNDKICGADFCLANVNKSSNPNLDRPESAKIQLISGIYLICMVLASVIIGLGLDSMQR